jgi:uncharacterized protein with PIN domain
MAKAKKKRSGRVAVEARKRKLQKDKVKYKCLGCGIEEDIPKRAIEIIDIFDEGIGMPDFKCEKCNGIMEAIENDLEEAIHIVSNESVDEDDDFWF